MKFVKETPTSGTVQVSNTTESRDAVVIGAGMVGVCVAWHLRKRGFEVTVIDKKAPGCETSWGCAGLIQRECVFPYGFPADWCTRIGIMLRRRKDVRCEPGAFVKYWYSLFEYWRCSLPRNYDSIARQFATLIEHCTDEHEVMMKASKSETLVRRIGFLELFRSKTPEEIEELAEKNRARGVGVRVLTPKDIEVMEPDVDASSFSGGVHFTDAWRVIDPGGLVRAYADSFVSQGGTIVQAAVQELVPPSREAAGRGKWVVKTDRGSYETSNVVVAAGPWSMELLRPLGYSIPLYPLRGYNAHFSTMTGAVLNNSVVDVENGFVLGAMSQGIRLTTGGELTTLNAPPDHVALDESERIARQFFPLGEQLTDVWWGSRPCMPDMKPVIGESPRERGLWMCFGHGHSGFTLGPVTGRLVAEMMNSESTIVDPSPFSPSRF